MDGDDGKNRINYQMQMAQPQPILANTTNTLPKNHHAQAQNSQIYGKITSTSRSVLTDVVNKVPSVINIPMPMPQQSIPSQTVKTSNSSTSTSSLLKMSSSKNNLSNDSNESVEIIVASGGPSSNNGTLKKKKEINANEKLISSSNKSSLSTAPCLGVVTAAASTNSNCSANNNNHINNSKGSHPNNSNICINNNINGAQTISSCASTINKNIDKPLPILTTSTNCTNPKEHFLPNDTSLDDDYLSECENCKAAGSGSRYYMDDEELDELPQQETMTLQRKLINQSNLDAMNDDNEQQAGYYRVSSTLPTNTNKKIP